MSMLKETAIAVPALAALLFVSHAVFGPDESRSIDNPRTWLGGAAFPAERFIAKSLMTGRAFVDENPLALVQKPSVDLTPQARISGVFAQFGPAGVRSAT